MGEFKFKARFPLSFCLLFSFLVSSNAYSLNVSETASSEQLYAAKCTLNKIHAEDNTKILRATGSYLNSGDAQALVNSYKVDGILESMIVCARTFGTDTLSAFGSEKDALHFLGGVEKFLRAEFVSLYMKNANAQAGDIADFKVRTNSSVTMFNESYYSQKEVRQADAELDKTLLTTYKCYSMAIRADLTEDSAVLSKLLTIEGVSPLHKKYMTEALKEVTKVEEEAGSDFSGWFEFVCRKPVDRLKRLMADGMLDAR